MLMLFLAACHTKNKQQTSQSQYAMEPPVTLYGRLDSMATSHDTNFLFTSVRLKNHAQMPISHYSMTCSWDMAFTTNLPGDHLFFRNLCFSNWHCIDTIPSFGEHGYNLCIIKTSKDTFSQLRIGYNFIQPHQVRDKNGIFDSLTNMKHVVWSNPVRLNSKK